MAEEQKKETTEDRALGLAQEAVMVQSVPVPEGTPVVKGYDFNKGRDLDGIMAAAMTTGFQVGRVCAIHVRVCMFGGVGHPRVMRLKVIRIIVS